MPDKKLTDNEIVKALENCLENECNKCPFNDSETCQIDLMKLLFDLINRLQAENERLKAKVNHYNYCYDNFVNKPIRRIKAEAYKECIEKVKETSNKTELVCSGALVRTDYTITEKKLDNLLKELVGETK